MIVDRAMSRHNHYVTSAWQKVHGECMTLIIIYSTCQKYPYYIIHVHVKIYRCTFTRRASLLVKFAVCFMSDSAELALVYTVQVVVSQ